MNHTTPLRLACAMTLCLAAVQASAHAGAATPQSGPGTRTHFGPLPMEMYSQPGQKTALIMKLPCRMVETITFGFPPVLFFENVMFQMVGTMNDTGMLPLRMEPVCG